MSFGGWTLDPLGSLITPLPLAVAEFLKSAPIDGNEGRARNKVPYLHF